MVTRPPSRRRWLGEIGGGAAWLLFVVAVAISGAGLVLTLDHPQTDTGRPELTAKGDGLVRLRLVELLPSVDGLADAADAVGERARTVYEDLRARDTTAVRADLAAGDAAVGAVAVAAGPISAARPDLLAGTSARGIGSTNTAWIAAIDTALTAASSVPQTWQEIADAAVLPAAVLEAISQHDALTLEAVKRASNEDWQAALDQLTAARDAMSRIRGISDRAGGASHDTTTLDGWITRASTYDDALTKLYGLLLQTQGTLTPDAQKALDAVNAAQQALPKDNTYLTIIVSDLGGQDVTRGLLEIDGLRGQIRAAADRGDAATATPSPSPSPGPTSSP